jgi:hypothetical protein
MSDLADVPTSEAAYRQGCRPEGRHKWKISTRKENHGYASRESWKPVSIGGPAPGWHAWYGNAEYE